jgi:hypothetical protein
MSGLLHNTRYILVVCILLLLQCTNRVCGQTSITDSLKKMHITKSKFINNVFQQAVGSVTRSGGVATIAGGKSEDPYLPYQGKIIRNIYINTFNFDRSFADTSKRDTSFLADVGKAVHLTTRQFVVRNNLFIKEHTELNAYKVADNERYLRTLDYISDARIIVHPIPGNPDSVDLLVYTKDFFSISGGAASDVFNHITTDLYDANVGGIGQRVEVTTLYDYNRTPVWGYGGLYRKNNVLGSFIDATAAYSTMSISPYTREEETVEIFSLSRRLISPYSRLAGAVSVSRHTGYNLYHVPDSLFYKYRYDMFDIWAGYNVGIGKLTATNNTIRDRRFFSVRYYNRNFSDVPGQIDGRFHYVYNSSQAILGQLTFFRQDYYKTQYIYGFGNTEDLPYGYNIAVTGGWHKQLTRERPYGGVSASQYVASNRGDFMEFYLRGGTFMYKGKIEDAGVLLGGSIYSRLFFIGSTKIRQYANFSFTYLHNTVTFAPLRLNTDYGLRGFLSDSIYGHRRVSLQLETAFYLRYRILGFQFAPFPYADFALIQPDNVVDPHTQLFTSLGGGLRMRNENLVFETIEMRAFFFPIAPTNMRAFKVIVTANIRYRYPSSYITAPDLIQLN